MWRYQTGNQKVINQTTDTTMVTRKRTKNGVHNNTQKTKDRTTRTPLETAGELGFSRRVSSSCYICGTRCVILVINSVIIHKWGKEQIVITTNGIYHVVFVKVSIVRVMVFYATFNNISVISWRSVLLMEVTGIPGENHWPATIYDKGNTVVITCNPGIPERLTQSWWRPYNCQELSCYQQHTIIRTIKHRNTI